ncbi:MAG: lysozyme inhibitor LprI family protein [Methylococcaceae bacterium]
MANLLFVLLLFLPLAAYPASFDCEKVSIFVEQAICSEPSLSDLDDLLSRTYKTVLSNAKTLEAAQRSWLKTRNHCSDVTCIKNAYEARITELNLSSSSSSNPIVMGRCHMDSCWWWKVESTQRIQSNNKGELIKAVVRTTSVEYRSSEVERKGYPALPPKKAQWEEAADTFIFCSNNLPAYFDYDKEQKKFVGLVFGESAGATEGVENLYVHVCHSAIKPSVNSSNVSLDKPTDIFDLSVN